MEHTQFAVVYIDVALDKALDYQIPSHLKDQIAIGCRVKLTLQKKERLGTVIEIKDRCVAKKIETIQEILPDEFSIPPDLIKLSLWISNYYHCPFFKIFKFLLPSSVRKNREEKKQLFIQLSCSRNKVAEICAQARGARVKILEILLKNPKGILLTQLLEQAKVSRHPLKTLEKENIISLTPIGIEQLAIEEQDFFPTRHKKLYPEQQTALDKIIKSLSNSIFETHLLYGITGSGKTEVYLQAIDYVLKNGKSALFLVPEIALTSQTVERLKSRFQEKVAILHHRLAPGYRKTLWHKIQQGLISLVVGPRSALFSPLKNLALIIVDEEHDMAYKQMEESPCYHTRDSAVMRGKICQAVVILGSATPSFETYYNALNQKYSLSLLSHRTDQASLPTIHIVDMKIEHAKSKGYTLFSNLLLDSIKKRFDMGEQTLLFLNRRGFHTSAVCLVCHETLKCPHCSMNLTFHKGQNILSCHLCNFELFPLPSKCFYCCSETSFKFKGMGTEHVERSLHHLFPEIRTLRLDADTTRHKGSHELLFKKFRTGKADILIGTQMVAKGLHFPCVTLVGILNIDTMLYIPDFRSSEYAFQMITQVAGRSGRGELPGEVILQTSLPSHPVIQAAAHLDYSSFYLKEIEHRKAFEFPPFCHLVKLTFSSHSSSEAFNYGEQIHAYLIQVLPPTYHIHPIIACGHTKIKDEFRFQCLIKGPSTQRVVAALKTIKKNTKVKFLVDVDPVSTYF